MKAREAWTCGHSPANTRLLSCPARIFLWILSYLGHSLLSGSKSPGKRPLKARGAFILHFLPVPVFPVNHAQVAWLWLSTTTASPRLTSTTGLQSAADSSPRVSSVLGRKVRHLLSPMGRHRNALRRCRCLCWGHRAAAPRPLCPERSASRACQPGPPGFQDFIRWDTAVSHSRHFLPWPRSP